MENLKNSSTRSAGFTLVEILVTISIIGLLSTISMVAVNRAREEAKIAAAKDDMANLRTAILMLEQDTGRWPSGCPPWSIRNPEVDLMTAQAGIVLQPQVGDQGDGCQWTSQAVDSWDGPYISNIDKDPWGGDYYFDPDFRAYQNCASKETQDESAAIVSFGPNGEGVNVYDCDDIFIKLK